MAHYSTHCRNCPRSKADHAYGAAYLSAVTRATSHALKRQHTVDVYETDLLTLTSLIIETVPNQKTSNQRRIDVDEPPF